MIAVPDPVRVTRFPETVAGPLTTLNSGASSLLDDAVNSKGRSVGFFVGKEPNERVWLAFAIVKLCSTGDAAE